jgi:hypothetical protein
LIEYKSQEAKIMINDEELMKRIEQVSTEFSGQIDDLYEAIGMITTGRLFGWRVMRLASSRSCWTMATKLFGDPKLLMPERGVLAHKSFGLKVCDKTGEYWEVVKGHIPVHGSERKLIEMSCK